MKSIFALLIAAVVLLSGCCALTAPTGASGNPSGGGASGQPSAPSGSQPSGSAPSGGSTTDLNSCLADCVSISGSGMEDLCRIGCHMDNAEGAKDASLCDPIKGFENSSIYYSTCLSDVAGKVGNVGPCDRARNATEKDWCIVTAADTIHDPSICAGVSDSMMKTICMENTNSTSN